VAEEPIAAADMAYGGYRGGYYGGGYGYRGYGYGYGFGVGFGSDWAGPIMDTAMATQRITVGYYPYYAAPAYYDYGYARRRLTFRLHRGDLRAASRLRLMYRRLPPRRRLPTTARPDYYLIAFSDHSIRAAQSYQVVGDQLEWAPERGWRGATGSAHECR